jgi:hypothetical protein
LDDFQKFKYLFKNQFKIAWGKGNSGGTGLPPRTGNIIFGITKDAIFNFWKLSLNKIGMVDKYIE